jgi:flagellar P-ring protein precursor FlgI
MFLARAITRFANHATTCGVALAIVLACLAPTKAIAGTVQELTRLKDQGETILQGVGLVIGLPGTGDSGKELATARPLAEILRNGGNSLDTPLDLSNSRAAALVLVTCVIPRSGAKADDVFDVTVAAVNSAKSLAGGQLFLSPLRGPFPGMPAFAVAEGMVDISDPQRPTVGRVRLGARLIKDIPAPKITDNFELIIEPPFAGWSSASQLAIAINAKAQPQGPAVAFAVDERTVRVTIPVAERTDKAGFLADVLAAEVDLAQLDLPNTIIYNQKTGAIIVPVGIEIAPVAITHKDLTITTTVPPPQPTQQNPLVQRQRWTSVETAARPAEAARLSDLLDAFKRLDIPPQEQIGILQMLHKTGKLQARILMD